MSLTPSLLSSSANNRTSYKYYHIEGLHFQKKLWDSNLTTSNAEHSFHGHLKMLGIKDVSGRNNCSTYKKPIKNCPSILDGDCRGKIAATNAQIGVPVYPMAVGFISLG